MVRIRKQKKARDEARANGAGIFFRPFKCMCDLSDNRDLYYYGTGYSDVI